MDGVSDARQEARRAGIAYSLRIFSNFVDK